jgi:hypothetical protein
LNIIGTHYCSIAPSIATAYSAFLQNGYILNTVVFSKIIRCCQAM